MKRLKAAVLSRGRIPLFFFFSAGAAAAADIWEPLYLAAGFLIFVIFFKKPWNIMAALVFIVVHFLSSSFFIAAEVREYKNLVVVKTGSGRIYLDKSLKIREGDMLLGRFTKDKNASKPFFKPVYRAEGEIKIKKLPLISSIFQFRHESGNRMFFASGGQVYVAQALIFGDKGRIPEDLKDKYTISGLSHLLAMSGMHVGIISAIFLTSLFFLPFKFRLLLAMAGTAAVMVFGAFSVTVARAALFSIVWMGTYFIDIKAYPRRFLLFAMSLFMLFSPGSLRDISFLLSFGAVFGIIYMAGPKMGYLKGSLIVGVAATLITAPLSMYVFGTTNHLSVLSTVIMSPVIYLHILFAMIGAAFPGIGISPLAAVEKFSNALVSCLADLTYFGFILKTIPLWALVVCSVFVCGALLSRYKYAAVLSLLIIFFPAPKPPEVIFPELKGADKGFISFKNGRSEIFYQGGPAGFKYEFLKYAAKYGVKTFDYGSVRIFGGSNNYIKIRENGLDFTDICVNDKNKKCSIFYHTRSNSVKNKDIEKGTIHVIYKNRLKDLSIIEISESGGFRIINGRAVFDNEDKTKRERN